MDDAVWRRGLREVANRNLLFELQVSMICETLDVFGPQRCLFGSNFPIETL